jgi:hypothetical protein
MMAAAVRKPLDVLVSLFRADTWMGPGQPPASSVPEGTPSRGWDYPAYWNVFNDPRGAKARESGGIGFAELREMAKQTHVRAAITTVIDKQKKKEWAFTVRPLPGERPGDAEKRATTDPRIAEIVNFFEQPDGEQEILEIDAGVVYNWPAANGRPFALEVWDGGTIMRLIDESGRTPRFPQEAYQQWLMGVPGDKFTTQQLMYSMRQPRAGKVMGCSPVQDLLLFINIAMRKDMTRLAAYTDGNMPAGLLPMPGDWKSKEMQDWFSGFNAFMQGNLQNFVKLVPIPGGTGAPVFPQLDLLKQDVWEESWIRLVCFMFHIPVSSLVKELTRANGEANRDQADEEGEQVYTDFIRRRLNWIIRNWFGYTDIVARPKAEIDVDAKEQAEIDDLKVKNGTMQVDEIRERDGMTPFNLPPGVVGADGSYKPFASSIAAAEAGALAAANPPNFDDEDDEDFAEKALQKKNERSRSSTRSRGNRWEY